jgi:hypothetical protein
MLTCGRFFGMAALLAGLAAYYLGLADRPPFVATTAPDLVAIVALSDDKDYGANIMRLLEGTIKGIRSATATATDTDPSHNKRALMGAASRYGSPLGAEYLSVGLYVDDPRAVPNPRWAIGYAVDVSYDQARAMAAEIGHVDGGSIKNVVRAVRVSLASTLSARVPWRTVFTPMIGPRLHWPRGMDLFRSEGHVATCGRHADGGCAIAMEAYVTGPKGSREWIDYTVVMGDTTRTYDDLYPDPATEIQRQQEVQQKAQQPVPPPVPDAEPEREAAEERNIEPPQEGQETGDAAETAPEIESLREEVVHQQENTEAANVDAAAQSEAETTGQVHAEHHVQVPPVEEPEVAASEAHTETRPLDGDHAGTSAQPEAIAEAAPEQEAGPRHEESKAPQEQGEAVDVVEDASGADSTPPPQDHDREAEGDGDAQGNAELEGEEESEHQYGEHEDEFVEEEEFADEGDAEEEGEFYGDEEHDPEDEEEEYFDEEDGEGEYSDNDEEEDEVEHFEDEEGHDEF